MGEEPVLSRRDDSDQEDPQLPSWMHLEQVDASRDFRTVAGSQARAKRLLLGPSLVRDRDRWVGPEADPLGRDFLDQLAEHEQENRGGLAS